MQKQPTILPRFIRLRDAPFYLGMDRNRFNREVRPHIVQIPIGEQGIAFDRLDLDQWAELYKERVTRPNHLRGKLLWVENDNNPKSQAYCKEGITGPLTRKSLDDEYEKLLAPKSMRKPKPS